MLHKSQSIRLCIPDCHVFHRHHQYVAHLAGAMTHKEGEILTDHALPRFFETSINILDVNFENQVANLGDKLDESYCSFSCDLGPNCRDWSLGQSPNGYPRYVPGLPNEKLDVLLKRCEKNTQILRNVFRGTIKVENLNYFSTGAYEIVCDPSAISQLVEVGGVELLLDIGHAIISAQNLAMDPSRYINALPLANVSEVHISRPGILNGTWEDLHQLPGDVKYGLLKQVAERAPLRFVTLEYYQDAGYVQAQQRLNRWCAQIGDVHGV